eukprot:449-Rhodomonas_salina.1
MRRCVSSLICGGPGHDRPSCFQLVFKCRRCHHRGYRRCCCRCCSLSSISTSEAASAPAPVTVITTSMTRMMVILVVGGGVRQQHHQHLEFNPSQHVDMLVSSSSRHRRKKRDMAHATVGATEIAHRWTGSASSLDPTAPTMFAAKSTEHRPRVQQSQLKTQRPLEDKSGSELSWLRVSAFAECPRHGTRGHSTDSNLNLKHGF